MGDREGRAQERRARRSIRSARASEASITSSTVIARRGVVSTKPCFAATLDATARSAGSIMHMMSRGPCVLLEPRESPRRALRSRSPCPCAHARAPSRPRAPSSADRYRACTRTTPTSPTKRARRVAHRPHAEAERGPVAERAQHPLPRLLARHRHVADVAHDLGSAHIAADSSKSVSVYGRRIRRSVRELHPSAIARRAARCQARRAPSRAAAPARR